VEAWLILLCWAMSNNVAMNRWPVDQVRDCLDAISQAIEGCRTPRRRAEDEADLLRRVAGPVALEEALSFVESWLGRCREVVQKGDDRFKWYFLVSVDNRSIDVDLQRYVDFPGWEAYDTWKELSISRVGDRRYEIRGDSMRSIGHLLRQVQVRRRT
jgi:hypothetical protein